MTREMHFIQSNPKPYSTHFLSFFPHTHPLRDFDTRFDTMIFASSCSSRQNALLLRRSSATTRLRFRSLRRRRRRRTTTTRRGGWREDSPLFGCDEKSADTTNDFATTKKTKEDSDFDETTTTKTKTTTGKGSIESARFQSIDLLRGKRVEILMPRDVADVAEETTTTDYDDAVLLYGAGDVIWPASEAFARLVAHVPSLVKGKRVIDVGCGLGLVSVAAILSEAQAVLAADGDEEVLKMTRKSVERMSMDARTHGEHEVEKLDWTNVEEWPEHEFDVALASDVLYDEKCAQCVANVIDRVLKKKKKKITNGDDDVGDGGSITALLCDPANRENREKFSEMCDKLGLEAIDADFPGNPKMRLVQVLRK